MRPKDPLVLDIPVPCAQNRESMQARPEGWFCPSCNKTVVDFSAMTDREVTAHIRTKGLGCGRFRADQLRRPLLQLQPKPRWQRWAAAAALLLSMQDEGKTQGLPVAAADTILRPKPPAPPRPGTCSIRLLPIENPFKRKPGLELTEFTRAIEPPVVYEGFVVRSDLPQAPGKPPFLLQQNNQEQRMLRDYRIELPALPPSPLLPLQWSPFWRRQ